MALFKLSYLVEKTLDPLCGSILAITLEFLLQIAKIVRF